jgi:hypothetical protein
MTESIAWLMSSTSWPLVEVLYCLMKFHSMRSVLLRNGGLVFSGKVNGLPTDIALQPLGSGKYALVLAVTKAMLTGFSSPVMINLGVGADTGQSSTRAFVLKNDDDLSHKDN